MFLKYLGETLLHNLWQGGVLFIILFVLLKIFQGPSLRVPLLFSSLVLLLISGVITYSSLRENVPVKNSYSYALPLMEQAGEEVFSGDNDSSGEAVISEMEEQSVFSFPQINLSYFLGVLWISGVVLMFLKVFTAVHRGYSLSKRADILKEGPLFEAGLRVAEALKVSPAAVGLCKEIATPCVTGFFRMTILIPVSMASGSSEEVVKTVFLHEYMHILKKDVFFHFLMVIMRSLLFFNPFVWWICHELEKEREFRCDLLTSKLIGDKGDYARILYNWGVQQRDRELPVPSSAFSGKSHYLTARVKRVLGYRVPSPLKSGYLASSLSVLLLSALLLMGCIGVTEGYNAVQHRENLYEMLGAKTRAEGSGISIHYNITSEEGTLDGLKILFFDPREYSDMIDFDMDGFTDSARGEMSLSGSFSTYHNSLRLGIFDSRWAPWVSPLYSATDKKPVITSDVLLKKGKTRRFRVTDSKGKALKNAVLKYTVEFEDFQYEEIPFLSVSGNKEGIITLHEVEPYTVKGYLYCAGYETLPVELMSSKEEVLVLKKTEVYTLQLTDRGSRSALRNHPVEFLDYDSKRYGEDIYSVRVAYTDNKGVLTYSFDKGQKELWIRTKTTEGTALALLQRGKRVTELEIAPVEIRGKFYGSFKEFQDTNFYIHDTPNGYHVKYSYLYPSSVKRDRDDIINFVVTVTEPGRYLSVFNHNVTYRPLVSGSTEDFISGIEVSIDDSKGKYRVILEAPEGFPEVEGSLICQWLHSPETKDESDESTTVWQIQTREIGLKNGEGSLWFDGDVSDVIFYPNGLHGYYFEPFKYVPGEKREILIQTIPGGAVHGNISYNDGSKPAMAVIEEANRENFNNSQGIVSQSGDYYIGHLKPGHEYPMEIRYGYCAPKKITFKTDENSRLVKRDFRVKRYPDLEISLKNPACITLKTESYDGRKNNYGLGKEQTFLLNDFDPDYYSQFLIEFTTDDGTVSSYSLLEKKHSGSLKIDLTH